MTHPGTEAETLADEVLACVRFAQQSFTDDALAWGIKLREIGDLAQAVKRLTKELAEAGERSLHLFKELTDSVIVEKEAKYQRDLARAESAVLLEAINEASHEDDDGWYCSVCEGIGEMASRIVHETTCAYTNSSSIAQAWLAERERMMAALKPFSDAAAQYATDGWNVNASIDEIEIIAVHHLNAAAEALRSPPAAADAGRG